MTSLLEQLSADLAALHARVAPSLVQIRRGGRAIGAGTVWQAGQTGQVQGLVLTSAHVVAGRGRPVGQRAPRLQVGLADGRTVVAQVAAIDPAHDLAVLRIDAAGLTPIALGDSLALRAGQTVVAFGFPYGVEGGATLGSVVEGNAAGMGSGSGNRSGSGSGSGDWLAASLHLRPGHSGGPMVDAWGRMVGINTFMNGPDVGVAVPVHVARDFLRRAAAASRQRSAQPPPQITHL